MTTEKAPSPSCVDGVRFVGSELFLLKERIEMAHFDNPAALSPKHWITQQRS